MAQPTAYNRIASFSNIQAQSPADPLPGDTLDSELNAIKDTLDEIIANLALVQRDDGALANESVGTEQLSEELSAGINAWTVWVTATDYAAEDTVFHTSSIYRCLVAHTAGTFATDLAAEKWELILDLSTLTLATAANIANTPAGSIAATTVQAAIDELASEKAATSHTHASSAISDSTSAGRTLLTAANAAAQRTALGLGALALEDTIPVTDIDAQLALSGIIEPAALSTNVNDWAPTGITTTSTIRASASVAGVEITGLLAAATDGEIKIIENVSTSFPLTLLPSSASSAAANRFLIPKPIIIGPNASTVLKYDLDATTPRWRLFDRAPTIARGAPPFGLTLSNGTDATNDLNIAVGEVRGSRNILDLVLTTALTGKQLDADFAAGSNAGMRYSGAAIANTAYHFFLIGKADGTVDVFAYTGVDPTSVLPSGYIDYYPLGSLNRSGGTLPLFHQYDDEFWFDNPTSDFSSAAGVTTAVTRTLTSLPTGFKLQAILEAQLVAATAGAGFSYFSSLDSIDTPAAATNATVIASSNSGNGYTTIVRLWTNTSAQIRTRTSITGGGDVTRGTTLGFVHPRGKNI